MSMQPVYNKPQSPHDYSTHDWIELCEYILEREERREGKDESEMMLENVCECMYVCVRVARVDK